MDDTTSPANELPSGRFLLRLDPRLHAALRAAADAAGLSLNEYCARRLSTPGAVVEGAATAVLARAVEVAAGALVGVVVFGSWARAEAGVSSDVDVLVVVEEALPLERRLYEQWDAAPVAVDSRPVEPHFVHLPEPGARASGLWAEAALDGLVLFEREFAVSRWLAEVRRRIASGQLRRGWTHGQSYWVEAA